MDLVLTRSIRRRRKDVRWELGEEFSRGVRLVSGCDGVSEPYAKRREGAQRKKRVRALAWDRASL